MSEQPERRDISGLIADIRVDVATIKERTQHQGKTLEEVKEKIDGTVSRGEYETRHKELEAETIKAIKIAQETRDDNLRREGASRVWRFVFTAALAVIGSAEALFHR